MIFFFYSDPHEFPPVIFNLSKDGYKFEEVGIKTKIKPNIRQ